MCTSLPEWIMNTIFINKQTYYYSVVDTLAFKNVVIGKID